MTSVNKNVKQQIKAPIWDYYEEINENTARCIKCQKEIKYSKKSKNGLYKHLKSIHQIDSPKTQYQKQDEKYCHFCPCQINALSIQRHFKRFFYLFSLPFIFY